MTIEDLIQRAEADRRTAERAVSDADTRAKRILALASEAGTDPEHLDGETAERLDGLLAGKRAAADQVKAADSELAAYRRAQAEDAEQNRLQSELHDTGAPRPGSGAEHGLGGRRASQGRVDGPSPWLRASDGRRAALERGQPFADHEVVTEYAERVAAAERPILESHSGIGQLVRALTTTTGSAVVPTLWSSRIIDRARAYAAVLQAGTEVVPMDSKVVQVGRLTTDPTSAFRAEGSAVTASDPVFDSVTLTATTMSCLTVASMEYLQDAIGADSVIEEAIGKSMGLTLDLACLYGSITTGAEVGNVLPAGGLASPPNPRGILGNLLANLPANVLGGAANGTTVTAATPWNEILQLIYLPRRGNEQPNALLWPVRLHQAYANRYDTLNQPLRMPDDVAAMQRIETNQLGSGMTQGTGTLMCDAVCGDFTKALLGTRMDFTVRVLSERYAEQGQVGILSHWRGDFQLARPGAFAWWRYLQGA